MKKIIYILIFFLTNQLLFGQDFERKIFDYSLLPDNDTTICPDSINEKLERVLTLIDNLQSEKSAILAEKVFTESKKCPELFEIYSWALFRSGKWMEAISIIDSAINIYGSNPDLILRRGYINIEMAELGVGVQNIDGNGVYLSKAEQLNYNDSSFKAQNYYAALNDFEYISNTYQDRFNEVYITGYIYQKLGKYEESTFYLSKLLNVEDYADDITLLIVNNYLGENKYAEAENSLLALEKKHPKNPEIQNKLSELYNLSGESEKLETSKLKAQFYSWVPEYTDLNYTPDNYETILYFLKDNPSKQKIKRLKKIKKQDANAIDILIAVLNTHTNHGNGVEEEAAKLLIDIGNTVVPNVILLMQNATSTCTVTIAASILADLKDPRGWQPMVDYLPRMENIPFTLIPPSVPEQIIKFDREKGLIALLTWIKGQIEEEESASENPMDELGNLFASTSIYSPLSVFKKEEISKAASDLGYTNTQIEKLLKKIFND